MSEKLRKLIHRFLSHPATRELDLDDPRLLYKRKDILRDKVILRRIYLDWYKQLTALLDIDNDQVLELGSGAGFLQDLHPTIVSSDVIYIPGLSAILNAQNLPFKNQSLDAIVLCNVLHHISDVQTFFRETARCTQTSGQLVMIEPWVTAWSRFIYTHFHHEDFDPDVPSWNLPAGGHLTSANGALPWIVFRRDRERFNVDHPEWCIQTIEPFMPFLYLLSGGISGRTLMPGWMYGPWKGLERVLRPWNNQFSMFAVIRLIRR